MKTLASMPDYDEVLGRIVGLLESARRAYVRSVNSIMTATYWEVGRQIVDGEQKGENRAEYGSRLLDRLAEDLTARFGRGFGSINLRLMRRFYLAWPERAIRQTPSIEFVSPCSHRGCDAASEIAQTVSAQSPSAGLGRVAVSHNVSSAGGAPGRILQTPSEKLAGGLPQFPLPWSHYVKLLAVEEAEARSFYEAEALRGGWSVRQLNRQVSSKFYERTLLSRNKAAMLRKGEKPLPADAVSPEEEIKDPLVLEFLGLKDEYSETDLEEALIRHLESFLLELGGDFAFVGRQRRRRIGNAWYRIDLLFFHRRLRCLVIIDLKLGMFTHADAGQCIST